MMKSVILGILTALVFAVSPIHAADFQKGLDAYKSGNYASAIKEWRPLAEQGLAEAQNNLGFMYRYGKGVPHDYAEAVKWYKLAAEQGHAMSQSNLGMMYDVGDVILRDYDEAMKWYRLAAEQGYAKAQNNLGWMYYRGDKMANASWSVDQRYAPDYAKAVKWYTLAAEQGYAVAQHNLGWMHQYGEGVLQDNIMAYAWYYLASANGNYNAATKSRDKIAEKMSQADISKAKKIARECMASNYKNCGN